LRNISKEDRAAIERDAARLRELVIILARLHSLRDPISGMCEEAQLTPPQLHTLLALGHEGSLAMGDLARRVAVTEKTATGLVDRLERDGFVHRVRDEADRRVVHVKLTPRGDEMYREVDAAVSAKMVRFLGLLDASDRKALLRMIAKLVARLEEPQEGRES
jgi:DNA-binding MarR family transcriptional regulator